GSHRVKCDGQDPHPSKARSPRAAEPQTALPAKFSEWRWREHARPNDEAVRDPSFARAVPNFFVRRSSKRGKLTTKHTKDRNNLQPKSSLCRINKIQAGMQA